MSALTPTLAALRHAGARRATAYHAPGAIVEVYALPNGRTLLLEAWASPTDCVVLWLPAPARSVGELVGVIRAEAYGQAGETLLGD